ncbi:hypothetical protein [Maricaulis sp.]|uniref:hypothetical protein n=1 Tax=Maricaulis sp. TaxID=1486257 RepID=UPI00260496F4|nr:hypothetical protein [Maricaulis sp.]
MLPDALTLTHIIAGTFCVVGGAVAFTAPKGRPVHRAGGSVFFYTMLIASISGAVLGLLEPERLLITAFAGMLGSYLVLTGWSTARWSRSQTGAQAGVLEVISALLIAVTMAALVILGVIALGSPDGVFLGFLADYYFMLATMCGLGLVFDLSLVWRRAISDRARIARHLWRMGLAYFIAVGSFFTGPGARVFPQGLRESGLLSLPEAVTAILIVFWLIRTAFNRPRRKEVKA